MDENFDLSPNHSSYLTNLLNSRQFESTPDQSFQSTTPLLSRSYESPFRSQIQPPEPSTNSSINSSKAVLVALRALQDKIKKLEGEKLEALSSRDTLG